MYGHSFEVIVDGWPRKAYVNYHAAKRYAEQWAKPGWIGEVEIRYFTPNPKGKDYAPIPRGCDKWEDGAWKHYEEVDTKAFD